ncbi:anti-sigma factor family protein [Mycolicibacterium mageritense]|uniref:anti-sigma factor family protein n=1 Tax=Mycolicibacterium mageritense TaxID=53462 RepID=UPI0011D57D79|nr:zf-HC2 domain-containing protein [Mycolicibacterium mageritense]TXI55219.1 MAG: anti-sigma factor [Mycolicibacterium mageritense]
MTIHREPEDFNAIVCKEFVEMVTDYLEGTLDNRTRAQVERHLHGCDGCRSYLQQFRLTISALSQTDHDGLDPRLTDRLIHAFRDSR